MARLADLVALGRSRVLGWRQGTRGYYRELWERRAFWFQRAKRDEPPFRLYVGKRGRGKSLMLTRDVQRELSRGATVYANYPVRDPKSGAAAVVFESIDEVMPLVLRAVLAGQTRILLVFDEAQNHFDARDWERFPAWLRVFMAESRHYHVGVLAATQSISQVDKRFRILCDEVIRVRPVIEGFHHRFALFRLCGLDEDFDSVDDEAKELGRPWLSWVTARAFCGYSTVALPTAGAMSEADPVVVGRLLDELRAAVSSPAAEPQARPADAEHFEVEPSTVSTVPSRLA